MEKISAFIIVYNEGHLIERALKSLRGVVDEILVIHDGPCSDNTLKIAKKYTDKIFVQPPKGRASLHLIFAAETAKHPWLMKIDADEYLTEELRKNLRKLIQNPKADGYSFLWRWWDGKKYLTKKFPHKMALFRKSKISVLNFPGRDEPDINGKIIRLNLQLVHKPQKNKFTWKAFWTMGMKRARDHAEYTLKDFNKLEKFQYQEKDFNLQTRLRRNYPLLVALPFATISFFKILLRDNAWREGKEVFLFAVKTFIYQAHVCCLINKIKKQKNKEKNLMN